MTIDQYLLAFPLGALVAVLVEWRVRVKLRKLLRERQQRRSQR